MRNLITTIWGFLLAASLAAQPTIFQSGDVVVTGPDINNAYTVDLIGSDGAPMEVGFTQEVGDTTVYPISIMTPGAPITITDTIDASSPILLYSNTGNITMNITNDITVNNMVSAQGAFGDTLGLAGIDVLGIAQNNGFGPNVTILHTGNLTIHGGNQTSAAATLDPVGTRTAQMSGIQAVSSGRQGSNSNTFPGGNVTVTTDAGSGIILTQPQDTVVTAGISATSAVGPGSANGSSSGAGTVVVEHGGFIDNSANLAIGIMATATGAQFTSASPTVALAGNVTVTLDGGSEIRLADASTGVGVFAVSQAYTTEDTDKGDSVQGGAVSVTTQANSDVTVGNSNSKLSIGLLAVSAGTDVLINPFASQQTAGKSGKGEAGIVTVDHSGSITSHGASSIGIAALSIGGAAIVASTDSAGNLGSDGTGTSGNGSDVNVTTRGGSSISTLGAGAHGIVALSVSNGGIILNEYDGTSESDSVIVGNNQSGGSGTLGGTIQINHHGDIVTGDGQGNGTASIGIVAQSIGGGGGSASGKPAAFVGDRGGAGGNGGNVIVTTFAQSSILTQDTNSVGLLAQSIGGGGGNGGNAEGLFVAVGGRGGTGGDGGDVTIDHYGSIQTEADFSAGIIGQSVGGGGGHGGGATAIGEIISVGVGGKGGNPGHGGTATFTGFIDSVIETQGNHSAGVILQSTGGGGGTGGGTLSASAGALLDVGIAVGGQGSGGGQGGAVELTNFSKISTGVAAAADDFSPNQNGADSVGLLAQSIGGGGGHGGTASAKTLVVQVPEVPLTSSATMAFGGTGGSGGNAESVQIANFGVVDTHADGSHGVLAQSIGGGGGSGGDSTANGALLALSGGQVTITVAHGGNGGGGGNGSVVMVTNDVSTSPVAPARSGDIYTRGQHAAGIVAQSIGGGGGNGGSGNADLNNPNLALPSLTQGSSLIFDLGLGGAGQNDGGDAGSVIVENSAFIRTKGSGSQGILAQAIGGGGGNAGGGQAGGSNNTITANVAVGATGGKGGNALISDGQTDSVQVTNSGVILTESGDATAILAQSIGGGGGNGGSSDIQATTGLFSQITTLLGSPSQAYGSNVSVGGAGGDGGTGSSVHVVLTDSSVLSTEGVRAHGVLAQSISGGGGVGGSANVTSNGLLFSPFSSNAVFSADVSVGGKGGGGGNGGAVTVSHAGSLETDGYGSNGLFLQSIGGGGGVGADGTLDTKSTISLGIRIDGSDGSSGSGGTVTANQSGTITTTGPVSSGILAQSIGGGGGTAHTGGWKFVEFPTTSVAWSLNAKIVMGFDINHTDEANGGVVNIQHASAVGNPAATISTSGDWSHGIIAQSVGAGGGLVTTNTGSVSQSQSPLDVTMGADSGKGSGNQSVVSLAAPGQPVSVIETAGLGAYGVVVQSIGAGGGFLMDHSSASIEYVDPNNGPQKMRLGAQSSTEGEGGLAQLRGAGQITTTGIGAHGVILQSIGGGGGILGSGSSASFTGNATNPPPSAVLGGFSGNASGGAVSINAANSTADSTQLVVNTSGNNAFGLVAQSIGGGGGISTVFTTGTTDDRLGSNSSNSNNGGNVILNFQSSSITTSGDGAHGVVAQSIGGGGGIVNPNSATGLVVNTSYGSQESKGYGGNVSIEGDASVTVTGDGAVGILAQSVGGSGGIIGNRAGSTGGSNSSTNAGDNGTVTIATNAAVNATGAGGIGIFAQSVAGNGADGNDVRITVNAPVVGGSGSGAAVFVSGGASNEINLTGDGSLGVLNTTNTAIRYEGNATLNVSNSGGVFGDVYLARTNNANAKGTFTNVSGAFFNPVTRVEANVIDGARTSIGIDSAASTVTFTGTYTQNPFAELHLDIFSSTANDSIAFSNSHGSFNGTLVISLLASYTPVVNDTFTLIQSSSSNSFSASFLDSISVINQGSLDFTATTFVQDQALMFQILTVVPEPAVYAWIGILLFAAAAWRRLRLRQNNH